MVAFCILTSKSQTLITMKEGTDCWGQTDVLRPDLILGSKKILTSYISVDIVSSDVVIKYL